MYAKGLAALAAMIVAVSASPVPRGQSASGKGIVFAPEDNGIDSVSKYGNDVSWCYNWGSAPADWNKIKGKEFVPILNPQWAQNWDGDVQKALAKGSKHLLGPNEPDQPVSVGGTGKSVEEVVPYYKNGGALAKFSGKAKIGAPGISSAHFEWLQKFGQQCSDCKIDFVPLHFYDYEHPDADTQVESMKGWLTENIPAVKKMFPGAEIWLTEFGFKIPGNDDVNAPKQDPQGNADFLKKALPWLEGDGKKLGIAKYSYFKADFLDTPGNPAMKTYTSGGN